MESGLIIVGGKLRIFIYLFIIRLEIVLEIKFFFFRVEVLFGKILGGGKLMKGILYLLCIIFRIKFEVLIFFYF